MQLRLFEWSYSGQDIPFQVSYDQRKHISCKRKCYCLSASPQSCVHWQVPVSPAIIWRVVRTSFNYYLNQYFHCFIMAYIFP